jgi:hypothetical protein
MKVKRADLGCYTNRLAPEERPRWGQPVALGFRLPIRAKGSEKRGRTLALWITPGKVVKQIKQGKNPVFYIGEHAGTKWTDHFIKDRLRDATA